VINKRLPELGTTGRHTRTAVGTAELPFDITVETEMTASVRD
jgi:enamine deaminase RidA (YjgF/YER057c/UK114 family)